MTNQNQTENNVQTEDTPLAFLLARPSYVVFVHFDQNASDFAWTLLPVPLTLRGRDFNTQALSELMGRLMSKFKCVVKSHMAVDGINEGTPMRCISLQALGSFIEKDANNRFLNGWNAEVSDLDIAAIQLPFQTELESCLAPVAAQDEGVIEAEILRDQLN